MSSIWLKEGGHPSSGALDIPHIGHIEHPSQQAYRASIELAQTELHQVTTKAVESIVHGHGGGGGGDTWAIVESIDLIPHYALLYHDEYPVED